MKTFKNVTDKRSLNHIRMDGLIILSLLLIFNRHLVTGNLDTAFIYQFQVSGLKAVAAFFFHPFVHVSSYHFLLDAGAFCLLYFSLNHYSRFKKMICMILSGSMSLAFVYLFSRHQVLSGFCGLSGIAHGLTAVVSLDMIFSGKDRMSSLGILSILVLKTVFEMISGQAVFSFMHQGLCGHPIPASHLGGIVGGITGYVCLMAGHCRQKYQSMGRLSAMI